MNFIDKRDDLHFSAAVRSWANRKYLKQRIVNYLDLFSELIYFIRVERFDNPSPRHNFEYVGAIAQKQATCREERGVV